MSHNLYDISTLHFSELLDDGNPISDQMNIGLLDLNRNQTNIICCVDQIPSVCNQLPLPPIASWQASTGGGDVHVRKHVSGKSKTRDGCFEEFEEH